MAETPKTIYLKDYQPPVFLTPEVNLHFDLKEERTLVTNQMKFVRNKKSNDDSKEVFLNGSKLKLVSIKRDGETLPESEYEKSKTGLLLKNCPDEFTLTTEVELHPETNKAFSGLYKTKTVYCTQMEAQGFRRTTFFQDRPDILSRYKVEVVADKEKYPILLSNGNLVKETDLESGRHSVVWEDPFPKPSYLFALVAGDLDWIEDSYMTRSNRKVDLKIFVDKGKGDRARFAMDSLKQSMKWDEDTYRLEYDLDVYNIVAVDDFNMGAMENKGLNIFNSKYVLASSDTATDDEYQGIQRVIGHEYFHNWTGNRVTCRDWFQLSLKEGLTVFRDQEFSSDMNSRPVKRIEDVSALRARQFPEDAGPMAHPVRPSSYIAIDNFYTVTVYEKGAEVIRMLYNLLGNDMFKKGVTKYFELYDGQAVTTDDWIHAMEEVSERDLTQFKRWYDQAGTPQVSVKTNYDADNQTFTLDISQKTIDPLEKNEHEPFVIPLKMGLLSKEGSPIKFQPPGKEKPTSECVLELNEANQKFVLKNVYEKPILSINREFSAPVHLNYEQSNDELYLLMTKDADSFNRWESAQKLYLQTLKKFYHSKKSEEPCEIPGELVEAFKELIEKGEDDPALTARLLELPQSHYFAQFLDQFDPQAILWAYKTFYKQMSSEVQEVALGVYQELEERGLGHSLKDAALRNFKNNLMSYLYRNDEITGAKVFYKQFESARNMTDRLSALHRLSHFQSEEYQKAREEFRSQWKDDGLILNKLFMVTALSKSENTFEELKRVWDSEDFDATNPNNIYALLYTFAQYNWPAFHDLNTDSYDWFVEKTLEVDGRNPQVGARLGGCLNIWNKLESKYHAPIKKALETIRDSNPSNNLYEIVSKALKA